MPESSFTVRLRPLRATLCVVCFLTLIVAAKDFVKPTPRSAQAYPAHDEHPTEKIAIAADPYDTPDKAKIFSINFQEHGFLPVFFLVTNNSEQPISIANMDVQFVTKNNSKLTPTASEDIYRRLVNPQANTNSPIPFPIPHKKVKGTLSQKERDEIDTSQLPRKLSSRTPRNRDFSSSTSAESPRRSQAHTST